jgi:hypothetical protein
LGAIPAVSRASHRRQFSVTMTIDISGMAHVILTGSRFEVAREFYRKLLPEFGMKPVFDGEKLFYCVAARTAIGIQPWPASASYSSESVCTISA